MSKALRQNLEGACRGFVTLLETTTPKEEIPTIYAGEPSKELVKQFGLCYPRGTKEKLKKFRPKEDLHIEL